MAATTTRLSITASNARSDAEDSAALAYAQQAVALAPTHPALALALSAEALARRQAPETTRALQVAHLAYGRHRGHTLRTLTEHSQSVNDVAFDADGSRLATVSSDGTGKLWDTTTGDELATLSGHRHPVVSTAFADDGRTLATVDDAGVVMLWDSTTAERTKTITPDEPVSSGAEGVATGDVLSVDFSSDSALLVTGSADGTAKLWDTATGAEITTFTGHGGAVSAVKLSPDDTHLATGSYDSSVMIRHLVLTPEAACAVAAHEVTREELVEALGGTAPRACTDLG